MTFITEFVKKIEFPSKSWRGWGLQAAGNFEIYGMKNGLEFFDMGVLKYLGQYC